MFLESGCWLFFGVFLAPFLGYVHIKPVAALFISVAPCL